MSEIISKNEVDLVEIEYYTDPLCCWSWAFEPQWRRLRYEYSGLIVWKYRMGGLLPNWKGFNDPINTVEKPIQMGPVWMEAHHISGMPINNRIWFDNPPESSYPACIAVKCAEIQSPDAAEAYLRRAREAVMVEGKNISKQEVLLDLGKEVSEEFSELFDFNRFEADLAGDAGLEKFKEDLQKARYHQISRFPALTIRKPNHPGVLIVGYRPYSALVVALEQAAPGISPVRKASTAEDYNAYWGKNMPSELREAVQIL